MPALVFLDLTPSVMIKLRDGYRLPSYSEAVRFLLEKEGYL